MTFVARNAIPERLPPGAGSVVLLGAMALAAILAPWITPFDPLATDVAGALSPPSGIHWFGTDAVGRDVFSRVLAATRLDLEIAAWAVALSLVIGASAGGCSGYYGGWIDAVIGRITDTIMAFPLFVLAMGIVAAAGNTIANIVLATAVINIPTYVRIARGGADPARCAFHLGRAISRQPPGAPDRFSTPSKRAPAAGRAGFAQHGLCDP
jgi:peptide/nickel transport system permease protein